MSSPIKHKQLGVCYNPKNDEALSKSSTKIIMYILGINDGHLATAALLKDGKIIACVSEERFTGIKNQAGIPVKSIKYCLNHAKINAKEVGLIVFGGIIIPPTSPARVEPKGLIDIIYNFVKSLLTLSRIVSIYLPILRNLEDALYKIAFFLFAPFIKQKRIKNLNHCFHFDKNKIRFVDHHLCHAYTTIYSSKLAGEKNKVLILTCDGEGDKLSATVNTYQNKRITKISETSMTNSLGNLYRSITTILGMNALEHEYKVMGLAAYVDEKNKKANKLYEKMKHLVQVDAKNLKIKTPINSQLFKLGYLDKILKTYRFDYIGYATQKITEDILTSWAKAALLKTKTNTLALSGGVFMNVKANQKISELPQVKRIFIMPSCGDESNAIGATYWGYIKLTSNIPEPIHNLYLGPEFTDREIISQLKNTNHLTYKRSKDIESEIAKLLGRGEIVARFAGRSEWGARALGNRSILADPARLEVIETINKMIKSRDFWMPFAPTIMADHTNKYLINNKNIEAPHMIIAFDTTEKAKMDLKAAIHQYDKSARPQVLEKEVNPNYHKILEEFSEFTGRFGLLNTSFNLHGFPIVGSPKDALFVFKNSGLKYLALESYLIEKKSISQSHK